MKAGDWVLVEGRIGRVDCFGSSSEHWAFVVIDGETHTIKPKYLTPLPKEISDILRSVYANNS